MRLRTAVSQLLCAVLLGALALVAAPAAGATAAPAQTPLRGGTMLFSPSGRCMVAFNATNGTRYYGIMAGHCGAVGTQWYADRGLTIPVGVTEAAVFPGKDYALVRFTNPDYTYPSEIAAGAQVIRVNRAANPVVGQSACRVGPTTGTHCGTVQAVNVTITYPQGTVSGLFRTTICAEPGDSGGSAFGGDAGLGFLVGGSGNCTSGGTTYYQPLAPVLSAHGLRVGY
ncbi:S1 family peptidase [Streptomyces sp. AN091965]|uniref:S1 family peptidase n=1 Tax=Streptomyces sp. AN091965 TaxID=2927803 RepID=UPI001F605FEA|nr:S1 family peptidase [Streptomyces sp. AN091965]MCI3933849.1 S1 family peptidase [Streptomyces sp. AN091965]